MDSHVVYRAEIYLENDQYVALCPELDVSSFSDTPEEAKQALKEAVEAFLEECRNMGTLEEVLEESGYTRQGNTWLPRQPVRAELLIS